MGNDFVRNLDEVKLKKENAEIKDKTKRKDTSPSFVELRKDMARKKSNGSFKGFNGEIEESKVLKYNF